MSSSTAAAAASAAFATPASHAPSSSSSRGLLHMRTLSRHLHDERRSSVSNATNSTSTTSAHTNSSNHTSTATTSATPLPIVHMRGTGVNWTEVCTRLLKHTPLPPSFTDPDLAWRSNLLHDDPTAELLAIEQRFKYTLTLPFHPVFLVTQQFIRTFNEHYTALLPHCSATAATQLLRFAKLDIDQATLAVSAMFMNSYPELYSVDNRNCVAQAFIEHVTMHVYFALMAIYKRKNFYREADFAAKLDALRAIHLEDLGVSAPLCLDHLYEHRHELRAAAPAKPPPSGEAPLLPPPHADIMDDLANDEDDEDDDDKRDDADDDNHVVDRTNDDANLLIANRVVDSSSAPPTTAAAADATSATAGFVLHIDSVASHVSADGDHTNTSTVIAAATTTDEVTVRRPRALSAAAATTPAATAPAATTATAAAPSSASPTKALQRSSPPMLSLDAIKRSVSANDTSPVQCHSARPAAGLTPARSRSYSSAQRPQPIATRIETLHTFDQSTLATRAQELSNALHALHHLHTDARVAGVLSPTALSSSSSPSTPPPDPFSSRRDLSSSSVQSPMLSSLLASPLPWTSTMPAPNLPASTLHNTPSSAAMIAAPGNSSAVVSAASPAPATVTTPRALNLSPMPSISRDPSSSPPPLLTGSPLLSSASMSPSSMSLSRSTPSALSLNGTPSSAAGTVTDKTNHSNTNTVPAATLSSSPSHPPLAQPKARASSPLLISSSSSQSLGMRVTDGTTSPMPPLSSSPARAPSTPARLPSSPSTLLRERSSTTTNSSTSHHAHAGTGVGVGPGSSATLPASLSTSSLAAAAVVALNGPISPTGPFVPFSDSIALLKTITSQRSVAQKLDVVTALSANICQVVDEFYERYHVPKPVDGSISISGDDILSILSYMLIQSGLSHMLSEVNYVEEFMPRAMRISHAGYLLAVLQASVQLIGALSREKVLSQKVQERLKRLAEREEQEEKRERDAQALQAQQQGQPGHLQQQGNVAPLSSSPSQGSSPLLHSSTPSTIERVPSFDRSASSSSRSTLGGAPRLGAISEKPSTTATSMPISMSPSPSPPSSSPAFRPTPAAAAHQQQQQQHLVPAVQSRTSSASDGQPAQPPFLPASPSLSSPATSSSSSAAVLSSSSAASASTADAHAHAHADNDEPVVIDHGMASAFTNGQLAALEFHFGVPAPSDPSSSSSSSSYSAAPLMPFGVPLPPPPHKLGAPGSRRTHSTVSLLDRSHAPAASSSSSSLFGSKRASFSFRRSTAKPS